MKVVLAVAALVAVAGAASVSHEELEFRAWKLQHGETYESQRKMTWLNNRKLVSQGLKSYRLGMNIFADMDDQEYQAMFASCLRSFNRTKTHPAASFHRQADAASLPKAVNWKDKGYVTPVKDQLKCGSCWAFSATGALEGQIFKKTGKLVSLSEQQLVDCSWVEGNNGCEGGTVEMALEYVKDKGLQTEESYPYTEKEGKCRFNKEKVYATSVATEGPISADIDVSRITFRLYDSGVYDDPFCSSSSLNHAVLVVGYDVTVNGQKYWLVKNSWGVAWGEKGYIKMARNKNMCGIASNAVYPVV
uniref:Cathepsin L.1 n=1 Tax=Astyanax mexicanus TaxID=7994 RepID=A0A3B1K8D0_ASTMX